MEVFYLAAGLVFLIAIILLIYRLTSKHLWSKRGFLFGIIWGFLSIFPYLILLWDTPRTIFYTISLPLGVAMHILPLCLETYLLAILIGGLMGLLIGMLIDIIVKLLP